jgi:hypothetical protein
MFFVLFSLGLDALSIEILEWDYGLGYGSGC